MSLHIACISSTPRASLISLTLALQPVLGRLKENPADRAANNILWLFPRLVLRRDPPKIKSQGRLSQRRREMLLPHADAAPAGDCLSQRISRFTRSGDWEELHEDYIAVAQSAPRDRSPRAAAARAPHHAHTRTHAAHAHAAALPRAPPRRAKPKQPPHAPSPKLHRKRILRATSPRSPPPPPSLQAHQHLVFLAARQQDEPPISRIRLAHRRVLICNFRVVHVHPPPLISRRAAPCSAPVCTAAAPRPSTQPRPGSAPGRVWKRVRGRAAARG